MKTPQEVLSFWLDEVGPKGWYNPSKELDKSVQDEFQETWERACEGACGLWLTYPNGALAYVILMDQFPRNMFRDEGVAFSSDRPAVAAAKAAIHKEWDLRINSPARQFFYLPLMHSENLCDQDRCVRLICERLGVDDGENLLHARAHREVIRRFGRFPHRNVALGRSTSDKEQAFLNAGGYGSILRELQKVDAA